jgi:hypothetical protein
MGELEAERIDCAPYSAAAFKAALVEARKLTTLRFGEFYPRLVELFAKAGVVFAVVREIAGASVSGVTKWLGKGNKALLLLSLKYKTDDQFWFSLFHEACHILKHSKKIVFFEDGKSSDDALEVEANKFAADILIPAQATAVFVQLRSKAAIVSFAASIGIAPGIVVGRLQHDGVLPHTHCVELKRKYQWGQNARKE